MNKLVAALEFYRGSEEEGYHLWLRRMQNDCGEVAQKALTEHRAEPSADVVERVAKAIYLHRYAAQGGRWECVETKDVWFDQALAAIAAMQKGE